MKKMSLYSCLFNNADSYYLFNTETLIKAKISHALYKDLKNCNFEGIDSKLLKILEEKKFIVEEEKQYGQQKLHPIVGIRNNVILFVS